MKYGRNVLLTALLAFMGAAGWVFFSYTNELNNARAAAHNGGRILNTTAGLIEYGEKGTGIPVLSIHGAGGGFDQGLANVSSLLGEGYRIIAPSRFGYLRTPVSSDVSSAAQADAHDALLAKLGIAKV